MCVNNVIESFRQTNMHVNTNDKEDKLSLSQPNLRTCRLFLVTSIYLKCVFFWVLYACSQANSVRESYISFYLHRLCICPSFSTKRLKSTRGIRVYILLS